MKSGKLIVVGTREPPSEDGDFALSAYEPYGGPDESDFGKAGRIDTDFNGGDDKAEAVALTPDGKIVVAGSAETSEDSSQYGFALARYRANGALDRSFGTNGRVTTRFKAGDDDDIAKDLAIGPDGSITLAGSIEPETGGVRFALARYLESGQLDKTFGNKGKVATKFPGGLFSGAESIVAGRRGRVIAGGITKVDSVSDFDFALARYRPDGTLDPRFGTDGLVTTDLTGGLDRANDLAQVPGSKDIVAGGEASNTFAFARYDANGEVADGFPVQLNLSASEQGVNATAVRSDGSIYGGGFVGPDFAIVRLEPDGDLDPFFSPGGIAGIETTDFFAGQAGANAMTVQATGKPVLAGSVDDFDFNQGTNFALARYHGAN